MQVGGFLLLLWWGLLKIGDIFIVSKMKDTVIAVVKLDQLQWLVPFEYLLRFFTGQKCHLVIIIGCPLLQAKGGVFIEYGFHFFVIDFFNIKEKGFSYCFCFWIFAFQFIY